MQTQIRLLLVEQSDQGLQCLPLYLHLSDAPLHCKSKLIQFRTITVSIIGVQTFRIFTVFSHDAAHDYDNISKSQIISSMDLTINFDVPSINATIYSLTEVAGVSFPTAIYTVFTNTFIFNEVVIKTCSTSIFVI